MVKKPFHATVPLKEEPNIKWSAMADSFLDTLGKPQWTFQKFLDSLGRFAEYADSLESEHEGNVYEKDYSTAQRWGVVLTS